MEEGEHEVGRDGGGRKDDDDHLGRRKKKGCSCKVQGKE